MGKISVSFVSGAVSLWVTLELAERLSNPKVTFLNNGDIVVTNDGPPRRWDWKTGSSPRIQLTGASCKGRLPDREFSRTEALTCVSKEAGKILLEMPAKRKPPIHRKRLNSAQKLVAAKPVVRRINPVPVAKLPSPGTASEVNLNLAITGASRSDRIKLAVATLNEVKEEFGENFVLKIGDDGMVKATLLMEF